MLAPIRSMKLTKAVLILSMSNCQRWGASVDFVEFGLHWGDHVCKFGFYAPLDWRRRRAFLECGNWIDRRSVLGHHKVKMRTGCEPCLADQADQFALFDGAPGANTRCNVR